MDGLVERIQTMIAERLRPIRPLAPARLFLGACAIIFLGVVAIGSTGPSMDGWAALSGMQRIAVFAIMAASAILLAVSMIGQMVPGNKALAPTVLPVGVLTVLMITLAVIFRPQGELAFVKTGLACVQRGLTYSIPAAFLFWLLLRRGAILFPKLIGAAVGGLAG
jgi:ABC-type enterochelin transport system permease subunit